MAAAISLADQEEDGFGLPVAAEGEKAENGQGEGDGATGATPAKGRGRGGRGGRGRGGKRGNLEGGKKQPVTTCVVPGCTCPKYPGSRFCSLQGHKNSWDAMIYQRRSRKDLTKEQKEAFDETMKDDSQAGRAVQQFSLDNPPQLRKKQLIDFARFVRIRGERVATVGEKGTRPMTERAWYKYAENIEGLTEKEAQEQWLDFYKDQNTKRDAEGFRGAERLWLPCHEMSKNAREHYVDNQVVEGSGDFKAPTLEDRTMLKDCGCLVPVC